MKHWIRLQIVALMLMVNAQAQAESIELYGIHFPPYAIDSHIVPPYNTELHADGIYGVDIEIIREAYASQGIDVSFKMGAWKRIMRDVEQGLILGTASCRAITSRANFSYFSDPVSYSSMVLATAKDFLGPQSQHSLDILQQYNNIVNAGWAQEAVLTHHGISYSVVNGISQGVALVLHRNQDVFMTDKESLLYVLDQMEVRDQFSFYNIKHIDYKTYGVCFSKKYPDAERLLHSLNQGLERLKETGRAQAIYQKYGITTPSAAP
ncbi:Bacterial extracellular solute-binding proteins, family 3 [Marinomonas aquimarina]|uniref:Bacterial extracellular solute-binding proteins, family 3 n=1 Tax=Marinomonas aquimarina TaxID=295068 RepID=A0A1A8TMD5_9GAMM|nr:transporter substrate-binding domain-containing protein [Marinomonas aquimarina]SBS33736.1 Bacterial extracellular solute-binding proteins, family 3 [Marinomonas aquimarina]